MHKKFPVFLILLALLLPAKSHSQSPPTTGKSPSASATPDPNDYTPLPASEIIDKLQQKVILWQDDIINGMQAQIVLPNLYREMAAIAVDTDSGAVKDQKLLDLLSKYGITVATKDGKKVNTPSTNPPVPQPPVEKLPFVGNSVVASNDEKRRIGALLGKGQSIIDRANGYKKLIVSLRSLFLEMIELSKTDPGAEALVDKYHIKQRPNPSASGSPSPSPSPAH